MICYQRYDRHHVGGVIALLMREGWDGFSCDEERADAALSAPGIVAVVATSGDEEDTGQRLEGAGVLGFAYGQGDGVKQGHLSLIVVRADRRRQGIGRSLLCELAGRLRVERLDLVTDTAPEFYAALPHRRLAGFRIYPPFEPRRSARGSDMLVRPADRADRYWIRETLVRRWGSPEMVSGDRLWRSDELPALIAERGGEPVGLATYQLEGSKAELVTLDALRPGRGVGTALLEAVASRAARAGCRALEVTTTNDNLDALAFYQKRGLRLVALRPGAVEAMRLVKPVIPLVNSTGIPIRDEIRLRLDLPVLSRGSILASGGSSSPRR
jgi:ribosomal protein S18 acetylase RimI-like enzyme